MAIDDISIALRDDQIRDILSLLEWFSSGSVFSPYAHLRPKEPVKANSRAWWQFAVNVLKKGINLRRNRLRWKDIADLSRLRYNEGEKRFLKRAEEACHFSNDTFL